jgi:DNA-binding MarR family transcriptional regulator
MIANVSSWKVSVRMIGPRLPDSTRGLGPRTSRPTSAQTSPLADEVMTVPQLRTLVELKTHGAETVSSLAAALSMSESRMVRVCSHLVVRGLVIHVPRSERDDEVVVALSTAGGRFADDVVERWNGAGRRGRSKGGGVAWLTRFT